MPDDKSQTPDADIEPVFTRSRILQDLWNVNVAVGQAITEPIEAAAKDVAGLPRRAFEASEELRHLDQGSRGSGKGTYNYVVFDDKTIEILKKYGLAGLGIGLGAEAHDDSGS